MIHWGKFSSASPPFHPPTSPPNPLTSACPTCCSWWLIARRKTHSDHLLFHTPGAFKEEQQKYTLIDFCLFFHKAFCFVSSGTWVWTTSVRSSPELFTTCTCYQSCEYKITQATLRVHKPPCHKSHMMRIAHFLTCCYVQTSVTGSGLPLISPTKKPPAEIC